ncbi:MAG: 4-oxalocrotonate decarboxylase [Pseudomonadota bacterium]
MRKALVVIGPVLLVIAFMPCLAGAGQEEIVAAIIDSRAANKPLPNPSVSMPGLTEDAAYVIQVKLVEAMDKKGKKVGGYKAGLTSEGARKRFKATGALLGPMFKEGGLESGAVINSKDFVKLFLETEIGYSTKEKITEPVKDVESLKALIKTVHPVIELPDIRFADMKKLTVADIVADGVGSSKYLVGKGVPAGKVDVNNIKVMLSLDGKTVNEGKGSDASDDQWKALLWLINGVVKQGWSIAPDQILFTGALGQMIPGKPGKYEATYGDLGSVSFTVQ